MAAQEPQRRMLRAKIHRATITEANLHYEGSLTIPHDLLLHSGIAEYEAVHCWNVTRGTRFETYAIEGEGGSGEICVNGAAAHLAGPGDIIIIAAFADVPESQVPDFRPTVVFVDSENRVIEIAPEVPGPRKRVRGC
ncbi:MAG: aspartate 1-decarboxylase [Bacteroidetes bacterium]|nr:aspartate 1-decarboxylase [Bacteroidota bacterium]